MGEGTRAKSSQHKSSAGTMMLPPMSKEALQALREALYVRVDYRNSPEDGWIDLDGEELTWRRASNWQMVEQFFFNTH
jgi:hypothetical protein